MTKVTLPKYIPYVIVIRAGKKRTFQGVQRLMQTSTQLGEGIREPVLPFESATQFHNNYLKYN